MIKVSYDITVGATSPLMSCIVKHASWLHNRYQLHTDGKTSYERRWGNNYTKPICEFGETVLFQYALRASKVESNWDYGIWLGRCTQSDEHYVATGKDVYRTRTIRRLPKTERYHKELINKVLSTPWATKGIGKQPTDNFVLNTPPTTKKEQKEETTREG